MKERKKEKERREKEKEKAMSPGLRIAVSFPENKEQGRKDGGADLLGEV